MKVFKFYYTLILLLLSSACTLCSAQYTALINFDRNTYPKGASPCSSLVLSGNMLYGMTKNGDAIDSGCIFSVDTNGNNYKVLLDFNSTNGATPYGSLTLVGKTLFGMTNSGGTHYDGRIFSIDTTGNNYKNLLDFAGASTGKWPVGSLTYLNGRLYGITNEGGLYDSGCVFSLDTNGSGFKDMFDCNGINGQWAWGDLTISGNKLFGMLSSGGVYGYGSLFSIDSGGGGFKDLKDFDGNTCSLPQGSLITSGNRLFGMTEFGGPFGDGNIFSIDTNGTGYKNLLNFSGTNGKFPAGTLSISGNTLFGMTQNGGAHDSGCVFSIDTNGTTYTRLFNFTGANGSRPYLGSLTISGHTLYGMTNEGGTNHDGVIFKFINNLSGIDNIQDKVETVSIYPNPNHGIFNITFNTEQDIEFPTIIEVYNILGEQVLTETLSASKKQNAVTISSASAGIYFYRLIRQTGELIGNGKLIIL